MYKILFVDDEEAISNGYAKYFPWEQHGFSIAGLASSGEEALSFLAGHSVDLVITDIIMPGMGGLSLIDKITALSIHPYVVVLSGHSNFEYARQAFSHGAFAYILKGDKHSVLIDTLAQIREQLESDSIQSAGAASRGDNSIVNQVVLYINQNYSTVTLNSAAEHVHINPTYLSRLFKEKTGEQFHTYVLQIKIANARRLLENPHNKIYLIAEEVGYNSTKNFIRAFQKMCGMTPKEYRRAFLSKQVK